MKINIQYLHMLTSETMTQYATEKLEKLGEKYDWVINANVTFESEKNGKRCKIELSLPGPRIFAVSNQNNYELAVKATIKELETQLKKRKELILAH